MTIIDNMSINEAIEVYYAKQQALTQGDLNALLALRKKCPEIFDKSKEEQIREVIDYAKSFSTTDRYKHLQKQILKEKFTLIKNETPEE